MKSSGRVPCEENRRRLAFSLIGTLVATLAIVSLAPPAVATTAHVLTLDGNGSLIIGNEPALNPTGGITIEAWVRPTADEFPYAIVDKNFQDGYWLGLTTQSRIRYYANGPPFRDGNRRLPLARWSHVAVYEKPQ